MLEFGVLGPLIALRDAEPVVLTRPLERRLLAILLTQRGRAISADHLVETLWPAEQPAKPTAALQTSVSRLRKILGDPSVVVRDPSGYSLAAAPESVDADRFEVLLESGSVEGLSAALDLWRGSDAYSDFRYDDFALAEAARLEELRLLAHERLFQARIDSGDADRVVSDVEVLIKEHPLRERLYALLMLALYAAGRQADALRAFRAAQHRLAEDLGVDPSHDLVELEERILLQDPALRGSGPGALPNNLPSRFSSLVGRDDLIDRVSERLPTDRLVTLTGPGGVGKTTVATEVARKQVNDRRREAWLIDVAAVNRADRVPMYVAAELARELQVDLPSTVEGDAVCEIIASRRMLLILDNVEHVIEPIASIATKVLGQCPDVSVLVTSRERLGVPGEVVEQVRPLPVPGERAPADLAAERSPAVTLFIDRARAASAELVVNEETIEAVRRLCRRLDGLPLAIELAAARTGALSLRDIEEQIDRRFESLGEQRGVSDRHRSMEATMRWSYSLLTEEERSHLRSLSSIQGPFTTDEAACLFDMEDDRPGAASIVAGLRSRSLVEAQIMSGSATQFELLMTVREYARAQSRERGEDGELRLRHARCYRELARTAQPHLDEGEDQLHWIQRVADSVPDFQVAVDTFIDGGDPASALDVVAGIGYVFEPYRRHAEGYEIVKAVLDAAGEEVFASTPRVHIVATDILLLGDGPDVLDHSRFHLDRAAETATLVGSLVDRAEAQTFEAEWWWRNGDLVRARDAAREARTLADEASAGSAGRHAVLIEGLVDHVLDPGGPAEELVRRAVDESRSAGDGIIEAYAVTGLGGILRDGGKHDLAATTHRRGYLLARRFGFPLLQTVNVGGMALEHVLTGDVEAALVAADLALALASQRPPAEGFISFALLFNHPAPPFTAEEIRRGMGRLFRLPADQRSRGALEFVMDLAERHAHVRDDRALIGAVQRGRKALAA